MQLLDSILVGAILALFAPTALANPRIKPDSCAHLPKYYSSLPGNISFEILVGLDTLESTTTGKRPVVRLFTENHRKWDVPEVGAPENGSTVFRLKNNRLIPLGGSGPAVVTKDADEGAVGTFVFNPTVPTRAYVNVTVVEYCDEAGKVVREMKTDNGEFMCFVLFHVVEYD